MARSNEVYLSVGFYRNGELVDSLGNLTQEEFDAVIKFTGDLLTTNDAQKGE